MVQNFLSDFECDEIIRLAEPQMKKSVIFDRKDTFLSNTDIRRTSNLWVYRVQSVVVNTIYRRIGDLLKMHENKRYPMTSAEDLQVVRYEPRQQQYKYYLDWAEHGLPHSRYITVLMYLNDQEDEEARGEIAFPLAHNDDDDDAGN